MKNQNWNYNIIRFLSAQAISLFGSSLVQYAIIWYITRSTSSGKMLTISTLCGFLPQIVISLFAGVWIDHYHRKLVIMISDGLIAFTTLLLAISFLLGYQNIWMVFAVLVVRSLGTGIQTPAVSSIIPQIVPQEKLLKINGINSTINSLMMFLSPAISGVFLSISSLEATLLIDVITAIIGISITASIPIPPHKEKNKKKNSQMKEILESLSYLRKNPLIRNILLFQIIILFLISPSAFLTPLFVSRTFGSEIFRLTASEMTYSLGMVLGGFLITTWGGFKKQIHTTLLASVLYGLLMIGLGMAPVFILYLILNTLIGVTSPCYNTPITTFIQEKTDPNMHGRIFSFMQISTSCALPLGMVFFGPLADLIPIQFLFMIGGSFVLITVLFMKRKLFK